MPYYYYFMAKPLITVVETPPYLSMAKAEGMTQAEMRAAVDQIAAAPEAGEMIVGSGGCRKVRVAGRGKGKSGGYRLVTLFGHMAMPVYILAVLGKGSQGNFSAAQVAVMAKMAKQIIENHRPKAVEQRRRDR